jgi:hypothetical protein
MIEVEESKSRTVTIAAGWEVRRLSSREIVSAGRTGSRVGPATVSARRFTIGATRIVGFLDAWGAWHKAKRGGDDIPQADALQVECLRPIVGYHLLAAPEPDGAFAYCLVGQELRQLGWPETLNSTRNIGNLALRTLAETHCSEAVEDREASLYEISVHRGNYVIDYQRLALPFGDCEAVRFLLLGFSIGEGSSQVLRELAASR